MFPVALTFVALTTSPSLRAFDLAVGRGPADADARVRRAVALELAGERDEALADWQAVADLRPADHRPHLHRARLLAAIRRPADADAAVERAAELGRRLFTPPAAPPVPMPRTDPLTGSIVPVLALTPVVPAPPARPVVWLPDDVLAAKADRLTAAADWGRALDLLSELATRRPADVTAQLRFGRALLAWSRYEQAEAAFDAALRLSPDDPDARTGRAYSRTARSLPADGPLCPAGRAYQKCLAGDHDGALTDAVEALAAEPGSFDLAALTAKLLLHTDHPMTAVLILSAAVERPWPANTRAGLYAGRGLAWVRAGSLPAAERDADRAEALDPLDPEPDFVRGQIAEARQDFRVAVRCYTAALAHRPHGGATFRLAVLRATAPDPTVRDGEAAVALAAGLPDGFPAFGLRAAGHAEAGRFARAVAEVNAALAAGPPDTERDQLLRMRASFLADRPWRGDEDRD